MILATCSYPHIVFQSNYSFSSHRFIEVQAYLAFMDSYKMLSISVINLTAFPGTCSSVNSSFMNTEE